VGLAYARSIVRKHGGRIWCESELGVGTTFSFTVPRRHEGEERRLFNDKN